MSTRIASRPRPFAPKSTLLQQRPLNTFSDRPSSLRRSDTTTQQASSIYSVPDSESINVFLDLDDATLIYRPNGAIEAPPQLERRQPMRITTRHGQILCSDGVFRDEVRPAVTTAEARRSSDTFQQRYDDYQCVRIPLHPESSNKTAPTQDILVSLRETTEPLHANDAVRDRNATFKQSPDVSKISLRRVAKFCEEPMPQRRPLREVTAQELFDEPIAVAASRFVVADDKICGRPARRPSLVRRLSNSVKRRLHNLSQLSNDADLGKGSDYGHKRQCSQERDACANGNTIPIEGPKGGRSRGDISAENQKNDLEKRAANENVPVTVSSNTSGSKANMDRTLPLRGLEIRQPTQRRTVSPQPCVLGLAQRCVDLPISVSSTIQPMQIRTGKSRRDTQWSDFMYLDRYSAKDEVLAITPVRRVVDGIDSNKPLPPLPLRTKHRRSHLKVINDDDHGKAYKDGEASPVPSSAALPARKESQRKRVDTSEKVWMPPDRSRSANNSKSAQQRQQPHVRRSNISLTQCYNMTPDFPNINDLFDPVEEIIDSYTDEGRKGGKANVGWEHNESGMPWQMEVDNHSDGNEARNTSMGQLGLAGLAETVSLRPETQVSQYRRARQERQSVGKKAVQL